LPQKIHIPARSGIDVRECVDEVAEGNFDGADVARFCAMRFEWRGAILFPNERLIRKARALRG
jgi:hypothetical protein